MAVETLHTCGVLPLQDNEFSGEFPVDNNNQQLSALRIRNNRYSGTIPDAVWFYDSLMILDASSNSYVSCVIRIMQNLLVFLCRL